MHLSGAVFSLHILGNIRLRDKASASTACEMGTAHAKMAEAGVLPFTAFGMMGDLHNSSAGVIGSANQTLSTPLPMVVGVLVHIGSMGVPMNSISGLAQCQPNELGRRRARAHSVPAIRQSYS